MYYCHSSFQTLSRSIGENYEDELLYIDDDDDFGTSFIVSMQEVYS